MARKTYVFVGDRVCLTRTFLQSSACHGLPKYAEASRRGTLVKLEGHDDWLATVQWDDGGERWSTINRNNICRLRSVDAHEERR